MIRKVIAPIFFLLVLTACSYLFRYDGPYRGRVIDADTGKPIEGVVVLGVWNREEPTVAGAVSSYYDAEETVTDRKGNFSIPGKGMKIFSTVGGMNVLIFKAGYEYIGMGPWDAFKEDAILKRKVRWEGNRAIISVRKLKLGERKKDLLYPPLPPTQAPLDEVRLMLMEINKDLEKYGHKTIEIWGGGKI